MLKRNGWTRSRIALREWMPVIVLMCCTFVFNTSEFIPIGLLSDIAADFGITEARAGLLITVYAWVVALVSLPLMLAVARMECRRLMLGVLGLFIASLLLTGLSSSYAMLMASRIGVACAHAVFWSIVSPLAVRVAPKGAQSAALGLIITGTSIAMIVGLPLGRVIGLYVGWRTTFFFIAAVAAAPGPEPRHHFAAQGALSAGKPRSRGPLCAYRSHGNGPLYGVQLHRTVPGTGGRAGQRLDNLGADGVRIGGDRRKLMVFARL